MEKRTPGRRRPRPKATTKDIVGERREDAKVSPRWRKHYRHLLELRDEILRRQAALATDAIEERPAFSTHMADAGTDTYDRDFALGMLSAEQDAVYQIDQALDRIKSGKYGICELTGMRIEPERLEAIPWTRFSAQAEQELEKQGARPRARLGPRDSVAKAPAPEPAGEEESE